MFDRGNRSKKNSSCIVVGGGITGLITATILQRKGIAVTVLDKGRGIGGRLATRKIPDNESSVGVFDYGTQYFSSEHPKLQPWIDEWLQQGVIKEWCRGFDVADGKPRFCGIKGTRGIGKYLAQSLNVHTSTRVVRIEYDQRWLVTTAESQQYQGDILVITPPVPQSLALLDASRIAIAPNIRASLERVSYHSCIAVLALLPEPSQIPVPGAIALENESLIWLADNHKKGISPQGYAVTLHATPEFSDTHWDRDDAEIAEKLFAAASQYLGSTVVKYQVHRWRYSLPKTFYHQPYLALPESLVMAGDGFVSAKIEGAVLSGIAAGEYISQYLTESTEVS